MSDQVPAGWEIRTSENIFIRLKVPKVYDRNLVKENGNYPVLDQSSSGHIGFLESNPDFVCDEENPLVTFANHTCAVRKMTTPFGVIQNVFPLTNRSDTDIGFIFQILNGGVEQEGYKGHYPKLRETEFLLPPLNEQKKIASILTSVDEVIETTQKQINKLQDLKKATMNELLTKGIGHTEFKDSELGRIPKSWGVKRLDELVNHQRPITYGIVQTGENIVGGIPCVRVVDIVKNQPDPEKMIRTSNKISSSYKRTILKENDILFALRGEIGHVVKASEKVVGCNLTRGIALLSGSENIESDFLLWALRSEMVKGEILDGVNGSALQEIPLGNLRKIVIPVPTPFEQNQIADVLLSINAKIDATNQKLSQTQSLKKSLMQDLLTGKVRVQVN